MKLAKYTYIRVGLVVLSCFLVISCYEEEPLVPDIEEYEENKILFDNYITAFDKYEQCILCPVNKDDLNDFHPVITDNAKQLVEINGIVVEKNQPFQFGTIQTDSTYAVTWQEGDKMMEGQLQFTILPVIQIFTDQDIPDEPKIPAQIIISDPVDGTYNLHSYVGIKRRGSYSQGFPKLSYSIELWDQQNFGDNRHEPLLGLLADDDWILDAMYVDKANMRNRASFDLWKKIYNSGKDYYNDMADVKLHIDGGYVEVFLNNRYRGVYTLNERVDRKRTGIRYSKESLQGLIFKSEDWTGPTKYTHMEEKTGGPYWAGWELRYPKNYGNSVWEPFYEYLEFCIRSEDSTFVAEYGQYLSLPNLIDYFIFMNIIKAFDNSGKNIIMVRYDDASPFLICPWDLDATWGRNWDSTKLGHEEILSNALYDRFLELNPDEYNTKLVERWKELDEDEALETHISAIFNQYKETLEVSGAIQRENQRWPENAVNLQDEMQYIQNWTEKRLEFLDDYFEELE